MENIISSAVTLKNKKKVEIKKIILQSPREGEVLIKMKYSTICQTQLNEFNQKKNTSKFYPHLMGHEGCGKVISIGKGVKKVKRGDYVVITWLNCLGINAKNKTYTSTKNEKINSGNFFTFSQYALVSENKILKLNKKTNLKTASLLGCAVPTALGSVDWLKIKKNSKVLVVGLGGIGITILKYLSNRKDIRLYAHDIDIKKNNFAKKNIKNVKIIKNTKSEINNFDYAIESAGSVKAMESCIQLIKNTGVVLIIGNDDFKSFVKINPFEFIKGKKIFGSWGGFINTYDKQFKIYEKFIYKNESFFLKLLSKPSNLNSAQKVFINFGKNKIRPLFKF